MLPQDMAWILFYPSGFISREGGVMEQIMGYDINWSFTPGGCGLNHCLTWPWGPRMDWNHF